MENFDRQHQVPRVEGGRTYGDSPAFFDPGYCAKITREMVAAFHHLAMAPEAPANVALRGAASPDGRLSWAPLTDPRIASIVVYRRRPTWSWQEGIVLPPARPGRAYRAGHRQLLLRRGHPGQGRQRIPGRAAFPGGMSEPA